MNTAFTDFGIRIWHTSYTIINDYVTQEDY